MYIRIIIDIGKNNIKNIFMKNFCFSKSFFIFYLKKGFLFSFFKPLFLFSFRISNKLYFFLFYINDYFFLSFINFNIIKKIKILYENKNIVIFNKESGISIFDFKKYFNFYNIVLNYYFYSLYEFINIKFLKFINRLDKETSGIVFCVKNLFSYKIYSDIFKKRLVNKYYYGFCFGKNINSVIYINCIHGRNILNRKLFTISLNNITNKKKYSSSKIILLKKKFNINEVFIKIYTGRTHQIRSHLQFLNNYLLGDIKYGYNNRNLIELNNFLVNTFHVNRLFLHSYLIYFYDPLQNNKIIKVVSFLPFEMKKISSILNWEYCKSLK